MAKLIALLFLMFTLNGCVAYKLARVEKTQTFEVEKSEQGGNTHPTDLGAKHSYPRGMNCSFEPMLSLVSVGLVPTHCVTDYSPRGINQTSTSNPSTNENYEITTVAGWAALFLAPFSEWKLGSAKTAEEEIDKQDRTNSLPNEQPGDG